MKLIRISCRWPDGTRVFMLAACAALAGCAGPELFAGFGGISGSRPLFANQQLSGQQARELLIPGKTTQAEVLALLGSATVINFDSGQAVWVYRSTPARSANPGAEFVILFDRAKVVQKTRSRSAGGLP